jgi:hypothetical protein
MSAASGEDTHRVNDASRLRGDHRVCDLAARYGALAAFQWARANGIHIMENNIDLAAGGGHLAVLQWLSTVRVELSLTRHFELRLGGGRPPMDPLATSPSPSSTPAPTSASSPTLCTRTTRSA